MADIPETEAAQTIKLVGSSSNGTEQTPVESTTSGRLKVDTKPASGSDIIPSLGTNLSYDDMNSNTGGVARDTIIGNSFTKIYDSTLAPTPGTSGLFLSFIVTLESLGNTSPNASWAIRLVVDNFEVFGSDGILTSDLITNSVYGLNLSTSANISEWGGFNPKGISLRWEGPINLPITYTSGVQMYVKKFGNQASFRAGLAVLTKQ